MTDFNKPTTSDTYTNIFTYLNAKIASAAKLLFTGDTNIPTGALTYNRTTKQFEEWSGSAWVAQKVGNLDDASVTVASLSAAVAALLWKPGMVVATARTTADSGFLLCDGSSLLRAGTYADLFAAIGTTYGAVDGTHFNIPDLRGKNILHKAASGTGSTLAATLGSLDHTHTGPSHQHAVAAHYHGMGTGATLATTSSGGGTTGAGSPHTHSASAPNNTASVTTGAVAKATNTSGTAGTIGVTVASESAHTHTTPAHTHPMTGLIGLVTGGVDGNSSQNTTAGGTGATSSGNAPELVMYYQIKY